MIGWLTKSGRAFGRLARVLQMTEEKLASADAHIEELGRQADNLATCIADHRGTIKDLESAMDVLKEEHSDELSVLQTELAQWRAMVPKRLVSKDRPEPFDVGVMAYCLEVLEGRGLSAGDAVVVVPEKGQEIFGRVRYVHTTIVGIKTPKGAIHDYLVQFVHRTTLADGQPLPKVQETEYPPPLGLSIEYVAGLAAEIVSLRALVREPPPEPAAPLPDPEIERLRGELRERQRVLAMRESNLDDALMQIRNHVRSAYGVAEVAGDAIHNEISTWGADLFGQLPAEAPAKESDDA